jgi:hypothetical protein
MTEAGEHERSVYGRRSVDSDRRCARAKRGDEDTALAHLLQLDDIGVQQLLLVQHFAGDVVADCLQTDKRTDATGRKILCGASN